MAEERTLAGLAIPEELLRTAVSHAKVEAAVVDDAFVPGVGEGKPPPLRGILRSQGVAPLGFLFAASFLALTVEAGIAVLGPDIQDTFGLSDAGLGGVIFTAVASYFVIGLPMALWADRGIRTKVAGLALLSWAAVVPIMGLAPSAWALAALLALAGFGRAAPYNVHISYLTDAYPVEARARVLALHRASDPLAGTVGAGLMGAIAAVAGGVEGWRWALLVGLAGFPVAVGILRLREPRKGERERAHILAASGLEDARGDEAAPRILFGTAVQRLMRIKTLYFQFVAMAVLGFAAVGIPVVGNLYLEEEWGLGPGERALVFAVVSSAAFLGLPVAGLVGDRLYRRSPSLPLLLGGASLAAFGVIYASSLYLPRLGLVVAGWFLAQACLAPLSTSITITMAAAAPPAMRTLAFAVLGIFSLVFGGFAGGVILGGISDASGERFALTLMGPITIVGGALLAMGSRHVKRDITMAIEDVLEEHRERMRRRAGGAAKALQVRSLDFSYGDQQVLFDVSLEVDEGEVCALLGTNGAGKSTLLRVVAGLEHPSRGVVRLFGVNATYLEAEQIMARGVSMLPGGRMTFPSLSVEENLRAGAYGLRRSRVAEDLERVYAAFPALRDRRRQRAGTLSGGEQQMLGLGRALIHRPRMLLVDELTLGLAPRVVEELLGIIRAINERGTTVLLVEQSVNLALTLAPRAFFLERGQVRYEGPAAELLGRDDLLRPVFLPGAKR